jgi:hypothetical protein
MIRPSRRQRRALLALALAAVSLACLREVAEMGAPLYPNGETTRLPLEQVAQVTGPIGKIDEKVVAGQSGWFDLLPGCHVVELDRRVVADGYALSGARYWTGQFSTTIYAIHMKQGARYVIQRQIYSDGNSNRVILSAREEGAGGAIAELAPAKSGEEIAVCRLGRADQAPSRDARAPEPGALTGAAPAQ